MREPFVWGQNDCALFVGRIIEAITGEDMAAPFRGTYNTASGADVALSAAGYPTLLDFAVKNFEEVHPSQARRGDIALMRAGDDRWTAGFFADSRIGSLGLSGYATVERKKAERSFKVGD